MHEILHADVVASGGDDADLNAAYQTAKLGWRARSQPVVLYLPDAEGAGHVDIQQLRARFEWALISEALIRHDGNKKKTAEYLGISRSHLYKRLEQFQDNRGPS